MNAIGAVRTSEVLANLRASPLLTALIGVIAFVGTLGSLFFVGSETASISRDWQHRVEAGVYVFVAAPLFGSGVPAPLCDSANSVTGVIGAGGIYERSEVTPAQSPQSTASILRVTPGFPSATWSKFKLRGDSSVIAPRDFAERFGFVPMRDFVFKDKGGSAWDSAKIGIVMTQRNLIDGVNDALVIVQSARSGAVQTCIISTSPASANTVGTALNGVFGSAYTVKPFIESEVESRTPQQLLDARAGLWATTLFGLSMMTLQLLLWIGRRRDFALYLTVGMTPHDLRHMLCSESAIKILLPATAGSVLACLLLADTPHIAVQASATAYLIVLSTIFLTPAIGGWLLMRLPVIGVIKGL